MKPKLVVVADTYYPKVDGVLIFMEEFLRRAHHDFDLRLLVPAFSKEKKIDSLKITFLDVYYKMKMFTYEGIKINVKNIRKIKEAVYDANTIFIQELGPVGIIALHYAQKYGKKKVLYVHNTPWDFLSKYFSLNRFWSEIIKQFFVRWYNKSDILLIPYPGLIDEIRIAGVHAEMQLARLGVDISRFSPLKDKDKAKTKLQLPLKPIIGYVGRISNEKNTLTLLHAFKKLGRKDAILLMVGDGRTELVKKFRESRNVIVTGFVNNVEEYLQAMDLFVMPSLTETTSLATLEAMATGLPVIVTKVGFMKNYIIKDHNGIFFPRNSVSLLSLKMDNLLRKSELRERLGQNARKTVTSNFTWEKSINKIKKFLDG